MLGTKVLKRPRQFVGAGVFFDEFKNAQVPFCIDDDALEILQLEEANIAVMILDDLLLEPSAILSAQAESFVVAVVFAAEFFRRLM
jgi:hypothetical protein